MEWLLKQQAVDGKLSNKIFFSDEVHFILGGLGNKQNCRSEKPQVIEERPLHPEKVTVWCALWSEGVFENDDGTTIAVNLERYGHMIIDFFFCLLLKNTS